MHFELQVRYLVPHLLSQMQLRKGLAEVGETQLVTHLWSSPSRQALRVPLFAVSVYDENHQGRSLVDAEVPTGWLFK